MNPASSDNETLCRQLELVVQENHHLRIKHASEIHELQSTLSQLTSELSNIYSRLQQSTLSRAPRPESPFESRSHHSGRSSPSRSLESRPLRVAQIDCEVQCNMLPHSSSSLVDRGTSPILPNFPQGAGVSPSSTPPLNLPSKTVIEAVTPTHLAFQHVSTSGSRLGALSPPPTSSFSDADVPTLAKEADRLLGMISKLRLERQTVPAALSPAVREGKLYA